MVQTLLHPSVPPPIPLLTFITDDMVAAVPALLLFIRILLVTGRRAGRKNAAAAGKSATTRRGKGKYICFHLLLLLHTRETKVHEAPAFLILNYYGCCCCCCSCVFTGNPTQPQRDHEHGHPHRGNLRVCGSEILWFARVGGRTFWGFFEKSPVWSTLFLVPRSLPLKHPPDLLELM